jgi:hypothetical protein
MQYYCVVNKLTLNLHSNYKAKHRQQCCMAVKLLMTISEIIAQNNAVLKAKLLPCCISK